MVRRGRVQVRAREGAWPRGWASGGACGSEAGPWRWLGCFGFFHFFLLSKSFSISISHFYLHLGHLCMYTCVGKHVHILMGSTRGRLEY